MDDCVGCGVDKTDIKKAPTWEAFFILCKGLKPNHISRESIESVIELSTEDVGTWLVNTIQNAAGAPDPGDVSIVDE